MEENYKFSFFQEGHNLALIYSAANLLHPPPNPRPCNGRLFNHVFFTVWLRSFPPFFSLPPLSVSQVTRPRTLSRWVAPPASCSISANLESLNRSFNLRYPWVHGAWDVWGEIRWIGRRVCFWDVHAWDGHFWIPLLRVPKCCADLPPCHKCKCPLTASTTSTQMVPLSGS